MDSLAREARRSDARAPAADLRVRQRTGGSRQLRELIDAHGAALLADFQQFYGINLQTWWTGELGSRRALILAEQLVAIPESRFRAARRGEQISIWHWPHVQETIADLYDLFVRILAGLGGNDAAEDALYARPRLLIEQPPIPTIADFDVAGFMRQINS